MTLTAAGAGLYALALSLLPGQPPPPAEASWRAQSGFAFELPSGWRIEREIPAYGLVLQPPVNRSWPVELVVWPVSVGVTTADQAAAEHERLLAARVAYERTRVESVPGPGGGAVEVEGVVLQPDGRRVASVFTAFLVGGRGYVVGTFAEIGAEAKARQDDLDPVVRALSFRGAPAAGQPESDSRALLAPHPAEPPQAPVGGPPTPVVAVSPPAGRTVAPTSDRRPQSDSRALPAPQPTETLPSPAGGPPTRMAVVPAPVVRPASPPAPVAPPLPAPPVGGDTYTSPAGLSLTVPTGWACATQGNAVRLSAPGGGGVYLLPVVCWGRRLGRLTAEEAVGSCLGELGAPGRLTCRPSRAQGNVPWLAVETQGEAGKLVGAFSLVLEGSIGLVAGVLAPEAELAATVRTGARAIASFRASPVTAPLAARAEGGSAWTDPSGKLACQAPDGWTLRGGVAACDGRPVIAVQGSTASGPDAWFVWLQPLRPVFRELSPTMKQVGLREGDPYYSYEGSDPRLVLTCRSGADLVMRHLLPRGLLPLPPGAAVGEAPEPPGLRLLGLPGEQVSLLNLASGSATGGEWGACAVARAALPASPPSGFWQAACLAFGGGPGQRTAAGEALRAVIRSARAVGEGTSEATENAQLRALLQTASTAAAASWWEEQLGDVRFAPVLGPAPAPSVAGAQYSVPPSAVTLWSGIAEGQTDGCEALAGARAAR